MKLIKESILLFLIIFFAGSCKRNKINLPSNLTNKENKNDTLFINNEKCFVVFKWNEEEINRYKKKFEKEEDFYTVMDDINFYTAEGIGCLEKEGIEKITIDRKVYKVLAFNENFIKTDSLHFSDLILYEKGRKPSAIKPIDLQDNCVSFFSKQNQQNDRQIMKIEAFTPEGYNVLSKVFYDWDKDKIQDAIIVYDSIPSGSWEGKGKRPLIALKGKGSNKFEFWFRNDDAIPCRNCAGSADPEFELKIENNNLKYNDVSLISSTVKDIEFAFDENLNLNTMNINIENPSSGESFKRLLSKDKLPKINLQNINIEKIENNILNK